MNLRRGLSRVARATAAIYWIVAALVIGNIAYDTYRTSDDPYAQFSAPTPDPAKPWQRYWQPYFVDIAGRRASFLEPDEKALAADVKKWASAHPVATTVRVAALAALRGLAVATALFVTLLAIYLGARWVALGFIDEHAP